ncbi:MAG: hypothetical protein ACTS4U_01305 [Candidatus Hodgkinia cicadicola]
MNENNISICFKLVSLSRSMVKSVLKCLSINLKLIWIVCTLTLNVWTCFAVRNSFEQKGNCIINKLRQTHLISSNERNLTNVMVHEINNHVYDTNGTTFWLSYVGRNE